jgi:tRNA A-37 threonylcarbamoyl transferase component Bud32
MSSFVDLTTGGVRWHVRAECRAALFGPEGLRLPEWLSAGQATVVKHGPHRTVYRVILPGLDFFLKHYRLPDRRTWWREWLWPGKARREFERTLEVAARGVATVTPLAVGEENGRPGASYLLTETLPDVRPLNGFLETTLPSWPAARQTHIRQRLAAALGRFLAHVHDAGITQHDLHPGNLLLRIDAEDNPQLFLIDLHCVRLGRALSWAASRANLIVLNRWFMMRSERTDRLRFWRAYHQTRRETRNWQLNRAFDFTPTSAIRDLEKSTLASNLHFWRNRDRRCLGSNRYFRRVRCGPLTGHAVADLDPEALAPFLADPDAPFTGPSVTVLKHSPTSTVAELDLPGKDRPRRVVYKRFACTKWTDPWAGLFRPPPALRSFVLGHALLTRCLATPRPLAVWHRRRHGLCHEGYLLTEKVADAVDLRAFVDRLGSLAAAPARADLRRVIDQVARLVRTLHHRHLSHRDLKAANVLLSPAWSGRPQAADYDVCLIDLVGVRRHRTLRRRRRVQDLARLHASFLRHPALTRTDKLRFLRVYLRWGLRGRYGWKPWWRQIEEATLAKERRNLRNGRALG